MTEPVSSRGFRGRRQPGATAARLTPGQYETRDFPGNRGPPPGRNAAVRRHVAAQPRPWRRSEWLRCVRETARGQVEGRQGGAAHGVERGPSRPDRQTGTRPTQGLKQEWNVRPRRLDHVVL